MRKIYDFWVTIDQPQYFSSTAFCWNLHLRHITFVWCHFCVQLRTHNCFRIMFFISSNELLLQPIPVLLETMSILQFLALIFILINLDVSYGLSTSVLGHLFLTELGNTCKDRGWQDISSIDECTVSAEFVQNTYIR